MLMQPVQQQDVTAEMSSVQWLQRFGLDAQKLTLEQCGSAIGFAHCDGDSACNT
jgi:hypothetical protein